LDEKIFPKLKSVVEGAVIPRMVNKNTLGAKKWRGQEKQ